MRYRILSSDGDFTFGQSLRNYYDNNPLAVAQAIGTRLRLWQGEWFLDNTSGTPYLQSILGMGTTGKYDSAIREVILGTEGVQQILSYTSNLERVTRTLTVTATVITVYGQTLVTESLQL